MPSRAQRIATTRSSETNHVISRSRVCSHFSFVHLLNSQNLEFEYKINDDKTICEIMVDVN